jgi:hypothetical protein
MTSVVDPDSLNPDQAFKVNPDPAYGSRVQPSKENFSPLKRTSRLIQHFKR